MKRLLVLFLLSAAGSHSLIAQTYYFAPSPVAFGPNGAYQPYACQTATCAANNAGSEILYNKTLGAGTCDRIWSQSINGANQTNLSAVYSGLPTPTTYNHGNARWSPDGTWFIMQAQDTHTSLACTNAFAGTGVGQGNGLFVCRVSNTTCYELAIQSDNTGHFCAAGAACPVQASLVDYIDDNHGVLHWHFTPDGTKIYGMYIMGSGNSPEVEKINGTLRWATITLPGSGAPTLSNVTETDVGPLSDGSGKFNWYEGAGAMPTTVEASTCTIFATGINNADGQLVHTGILKYNMCTGANAWLTPTTCYQEFWEVRPQGDIGVGGSSCYLPTSLPWSWPSGIAGPSDSAYGPATTGKTNQFTFFNDIRSLGNPITNVAGGSWDWTGMYFLTNYLQSDNVTHAASGSWIVKFSLVSTNQISSYAFPGVTLFAGVSIQ